MTLAGTIALVILGVSIGVAVTSTIYRVKSKIENINIKKKRYEQRALYSDEILDLDIDRVAKTDTQNTYIKSNSKTKNDKERDL